MERIENMFLLLIAFITSAYTYETYGMVLNDKNRSELKLEKLSAPSFSEDYSVDPVSVIKSSDTLKVKIALDEKVNIKITRKAGTPVYLRQYSPNKPNEMKIDISNWSSGNYNILFASSGGENFLKGEFTIN